jgi:hypothetical protein
MIWESALKQVDEENERATRALEAELLERSSTCDIPKVAREILELAQKYSRLPCHKQDGIPEAELRKHLEEITGGTDEVVTKMVEALESYRTYVIDEDSLIDAFERNTPTTKEEGGDIEVFCTKRKELKSFFIGGKSYTLKSGEVIKLEDRREFGADVIKEVIAQVGISDDVKAESLLSYLGIQEGANSKVLKHVTMHDYKPEYREKAKGYIMYAKLSTGSGAYLEELEKKIKSLDLKNEGVAAASQLRINLLTKCTNGENFDFADYVRTANMVRKTEAEQKSAFMMFRAKLIDHKIATSSIYQHLVSDEEVRAARDGAAEENMLSQCSLEDGLFQMADCLVQSDCGMAEFLLAFKPRNQLSNALFGRLELLGLFHDIRVNFPLVDHPEVKLAAVKKCVCEVTESVVCHPKGLHRLNDWKHNVSEHVLFGMIESKNRKIDEVVEPAWSAFERCIGQLRLYSHVKTDNNGLDEAFRQQGQEPPDLSDYYAMGINEVLYVKEDHFWHDRINGLILTAMAITQITVGLWLVFSTGGILANVGALLIAEGVSDIYFMVQTFYSGQKFNWEDYRKQKAQSLALCVLTLGLSKYLNLSKLNAPIQNARHAQKLQLLSFVGKTVMKELIEQGSVFAVGKLAGNVTHIASQTVMKGLLEAVENITMGATAKIAKTRDNRVGLEQIRGTFDDRMGRIQEKVAEMYRVLGKSRADALIQDCISQVTKREMDNGSMHQRMEGAYRSIASKLTVSLRSSNHETAAAGVKVLESMSNFMSGLYTLNKVGSVINDYAGQLEDELNKKLEAEREEASSLGRKRAIADENQQLNVQSEAKLKADDVRKEISKIFQGKIRQYCVTPAIRLMIDKGTQGFKERIL